MNIFVVKAEGIDLFVGEVDLLTDWKWRANLYQSILQADQVAEQASKLFGLIFRVKVYNSL